MVRVPLDPEDIRRGQALGQLIREARADRTLGHVAAAAGISPETLRKIETGRIATPSFAIVAALADELDISMDDLWSLVKASGSAPLRDAS
ncbi:helix-turn-helix domain-containing protein [Arthrobacter sp.]|uniref:helix-turn-helix domain-containing protein n=1 Tax=Arthrobacter sp. TaxID=1667 RepID=UPI002811CB25|nr:helix-turn-helix transcriptional regulator [Arthrobacter sp.]